MSGSPACCIISGRGRRLKRSKYNSCEDCLPWANRIMATVTTPAFLIRVSHQHSFWHTVRVYLTALWQIWNDDSSSIYIHYGQQNTEKLFIIHYGSRLQTKHINTNQILKHKLFSNKVLWDVWLWVKSSWKVNKINLSWLSLLQACTIILSLIEWALEYCSASGRIIWSL